ncbi:MAG: sugar porter family MFS transporter [Bacteroidota bacterium]
MSNKKTHVIRIAAIVALGGFLLGFDASVISGVVKFIEPEFNLTKLELGWAVGCITLTAALGMVIAGPLSDSWGRRRVLKYAALLFTASALGSALAPTFFTLIIARLIGGLAVGASLILAPVYIAEVAPPEKRGQLVSFNQLNIVIGVSLAFFTNYMILQLGQSNSSWALSMGFHEWNWRWMLGLETIPAILYYLGLFLVPRSPRWLMMKSRDDEAVRVMQKLISEEEALIQIKSVKASIEAEKNKKKVHVGEIFVPAMRKVIVIGLLVGIFQQIVGINAVLFYAPMIFEQTGIGTDASFVQAILVGLTNLVFTIIAMATIDKLGRKPLLIFGMAGIALFLFVLAYGFQSATYNLTDAAIADLPQEIDRTGLGALVDKTYDSDLVFKEALNTAMGEAGASVHEATLITAATHMNTTLILLGILGFVAAYAVSIGPVMWVLFSELFPNRIRGLAISFVGLVNLAVAFTVQLIFPWELSILGSATTFLIYAIFAVIGFVLIWIKVPETKGKSLEELQALLIK